MIDYMYPLGNIKELIRRKMLEYTNISEEEKGSFWTHLVKES